MRSDLLTEVRRAALAESWHLRHEARAELGEPPPPADPPPLRLELLVTCLQCRGPVEVRPFTGGGVHLSGGVFCHRCRAGGRITVQWANGSPPFVTPTVLT
jgi:hypothetical protein